MKLAKWLGAAVLPWLAATSAGAVTEDNFNLKSTADLVALCTADASAPMGTAALNFCHGFVVGTVRVEQIHGAAHKHHMFCLPDPVPSRTAGIADYVQWAQPDSARMAMAPQDSLVAFLAQRYPCGRKR